MSRLITFHKHGFLPVILVLFVASMVLSACSGFPLSAETKENYPQAEVVFQVFLPAAIPNDAKMMLEIVDDVTGLAFNPVRYEMTQQDEKTYFVKLNLALGSVIKYRYVRQSNVSTIEFTPQANQVRFRAASIDGPAIIKDQVSAWIDQKYNGPVGRVTGQLFTSDGKSPASNLLVTIDGLQTITAADGTFIFEGVAAGNHNLVAFSMDGQYTPFQQGVIVSEGANTPVVAALSKRQVVNVTFNVTLPDGFKTDYPLKIASNFQSLGNSYADLGSGSTTIAASLPILTKTSGNKYSITLALPAGADFRYKFTLGDGLWNSELNDQGSFVVRQLLVASKNQTINCKIATFTTPGFAPVSFDVFSKLTLPAGENVSIQLNPFGWFVPLPMLKISDYEWKYTLYSPMNILGPVEYRFCRDNACEMTSAVANTQQTFSPAQEEQNFTVKIDQWTNLLPYQISPDQLLTDGSGLKPRTDFLTGFEITQNYSIAESANISNGLSKILSEGSNFVILTPTWTAIRSNPPILEAAPGKNTSLNELDSLASSLQKQGTKVAVFPIVQYSNEPKDFWKESAQTGWWQSWNDRYQRYILQYADWANSVKADAIILGDPTVKFSEEPSDTWKSLISKIRSRFTGKIIGVLSYPTTSTADLSWLTTVDEVYILYSPALSSTSSTSTKELVDIIDNDFEKNLHWTIDKINKPALLGINYPSAQNAFAGCADTLGSCMNNWGDGSVDLNVQMRIYNAAIIAAAKQNWISGFVSRGFYPGTAISDNSSSINGKPAMDILWFWYHFILNKTS